MVYEDNILEIIGVDGKIYLITERLFFDDKDDNILIDVQELSRIEIKSDKDKIVDLEAKNAILEAAKTDFETRIRELESKV